MAKIKYQAGQVWPTKKYGDVLIVNYHNWNSVDVRFLNTGFEKNICMSQVKNGTVKDTSVDTTPLDMRQDVIHTTNHYGDVKVLKYFGWDKVSIEFLLTGNIREVRADDIRSGSVRDAGSGLTCTMRERFLGDVKILPNGNVLTIKEYLYKSEVGNIYFSVECSSCSEDKELHPDLFKSTAANWVAGCTPCPCSNSYYWNRNQYRILINRKLRNTSWVLKDIPEIDKGNVTKVEIYCNKHNQTHKVNISNILEGKSPCKVCTEFKQRRTKLKTWVERYNLKDTREVFYILRFTGKGVSFIKSGICVYEGDVDYSVKLRYLKGDYTGFDYEILHTEVGYYEEIALLEIDSQESNQHNKFISYALKGFAGYSECFTEFHYKGNVYKTT